MNSHVLSSTTIINALLIALANILLAEDGAPRVCDASTARRLLVQVFTSPNNGNTLKISCIKFVRSNTDMDLKDAKTFVEDYVFIGTPTSQPMSRIRRMQERVGVDDRY